MFKLLLKLLCSGLAGFLLLVPCLRGFYLLHHDADLAAQSAREFLLQAAQELDDFALDHGGRFPAELDALPCARRAREGSGIGFVWGGLLRAPLAESWQHLSEVRAGALLDPWGSAWRYELDPEAARVRLWSEGPDRAPGGPITTRDDLVLTMDGLATSLSFLGHEPLW